MNEDFSSQIRTGVTVVILAMLMSVVLYLLVLINPVFNDKVMTFTANAENLDGGILEELEAEPLVNSILLYKILTPIMEDEELTLEIIGSTGAITNEVSSLLEMPYANYEVEVDDKSSKSITLKEVSN